MERALRRVSLEQGYDPREYTLVPFGGAGPLHACDLAQSLGIDKLLIPRHPGVLSALGLLMADVSSDTSQAVLRPVAELLHFPDTLTPIVLQLTDQVITDLQSNPMECQVACSLDLRYTGQSYEITVPMALPVTKASLKESVDAFHAAHQQRYGYASPDLPVDCVTLRVQASLPGARSASAADVVSRSDASEALVYTRPIWFEDQGPMEVPCYDRDRLRFGHSLSGPALVVQYDTTLVVNPGWQLRVDQWHHAHLTYHSND